MNLTLDLKRLSETKMISRRDLKCYVDSWTGPLSGEARDAPSKPCIYAFLAPESGFVKIGSTARPVARLYHLRNAPTSPYWPIDANLGRFEHLEPLPSLPVARTAERLCHRVLAFSRLPTRSQHANRNEWYDVEPLTAVRATILAAFFAENPEHFSNTEDYHEMLSKL